jgi:hypothetical protein
MPSMTSEEVELADCFKHDDPNAANLAELKDILDKSDNVSKPLAFGPDFIQALADKSRVGE